MITLEGYCLLGVILLKTKAAINKMVTPVITGENTNSYPKLVMLDPPVTAIKAVAPPGGCNDLAICIAIIDVETARGAAIQRYSPKIL